MAAERLPLDKMEQNKTKYEWQRDAFRDINKKIAEFDKLILDMKMSSTYQTKKVSSTMESAVTATGSGSASDGTYEIAVKQLASNAINVSTVTQDAFGTELGTFLGEETSREVKFNTFGKPGEISGKDKTKVADGFGKFTHTFTVDANDTIESIATKINEKSDGRYHAFVGSDFRKFCYGDNETWRL